MEVDLTGTALEGRSLPPVKIERSETDWLHSWVEANQFYAAGGAQNLTEMRRIFRERSAPEAGQRESGEHVACVLGPNGNEPGAPRSADGGENRQTRFRLAPQARRTLEQGATRSHPGGQMCYVWAP